MGSASSYYLPVGQPEGLDYVSCLTKEQPLTLFIYNRPQLIKVHFEPETLPQLSRLEKLSTSRTNRQTSRISISSAR